MGLFGRFLGAKLLFPRLGNTTLAKLGWAARLAHRVSKQGISVSLWNRANIRLGVPIKVSEDYVIAAIPANLSSLIACVTKKSPEFGTVQNIACVA